MPFAAYSRSFGTTSPRMRRPTDVFWLRSSTRPVSAFFGTSVDQYMTWQSKRLTHFPRRAVHQKRELRELDFVDHR
jgi:hypothetical protein